MGSSIPLTVQDESIFLVAKRFGTHIILYSTGSCPVLCAPGLGLHWTLFWTSLVFPVDFRSLDVLVIIVITRLLQFHCPAHGLHNRWSCIRIECCTKGQTYKKCWMVMGFGFKKVMHVLYMPDLRLSNIQYTPQGGGTTAQYHG